MELQWRRSVQIHIYVELQLSECDKKIIYSKYKVLLHFILTPEIVIGIIIVKLNNKKTEATAPVFKYNL